MFASVGSQLSDPFVHYVAGFFDGEGSIDIRFEAKVSKNGKRYERFYLRASVIQIDRRPLDLMQARWGGSVSRRKAQKSTACHTWVVTTKSAAAFLADIAPHLIVKRREAELAIEFQWTVRDGLVNTAGSKGVDRLSPEIRQRRYDLMLALRDERLNKGLFARPRANVPSERVH